MARDLSPFLPEKFRVIFPARRCTANVPEGGYPASYSKTVDLSSITLSDSSIDPQPKGVEQTVWTVRDTAVALYSSAAGPATNQAALDDLATIAGQDFFDFRSVRFDKVYSGINSIPPNALIDLIEFAYTSTTQTTRIQSLPYGGEPREFQRQDPSIASCHADDRTPGILLDIPGGAPLMSMRGRLDLSDGRLVLTYDFTDSLPCGCSTPTPCAHYCIVVTSSCGGSITGANVTLSAKQVTSVTITNGGSGYTSAPLVAFGTGAFGSGAAATATISGGVVTSIAVTAPGAYTSTPGITFSGGGGSGATATANMTTNTIGTCVTSGQVTGVTMTNNGSNYTVAPSVVFTPTSGGSGATGTANLGLGSVSGVTVTAGGSGYTTAPGVVFAGGGGVSAAARALLTPTTVASLTLTAGGTSFTSIPSVSFGTPAGHTGSGAAASASMGVNSIASVGSGGAGYTVGDVLTVAGGTSSVAATLTVTTAAGGVISAVSISNAGVYTAIPANPVSVTGGTGIGATFNVRYRVVALTLTNPGTNYSTAPTVSITGGGGASATATAALAPTSVASVTVTAPGSSYTSAPSVSFSGGGGGSGATATANIKFKVASVTITANGSGYITAPTVTFPGGDGTGAAGTASISIRCCVGIFYGGAYTVGASATDHLTGSSPQGDIPGCTDRTASVALTKNSNTACVTVIGCNSIVLDAGEDVEIIQGGVTIASGPTAGASKNFCADIPLVSTTYQSTYAKYSPARFNTGTTVSTPLGCSPNNITVSGSVASAYVCFPLYPTGTNCPYPPARILHITDPLYGVTTMTYGLSGVGGRTADGWLGTNTATYSGCAALGCPAKAGVLITYFLGNDCNVFAGPGDATACRYFNITFSANNVTSCPDTFPAATTKGPVGGPLVPFGCPPTLLYNLTYSFGQVGLNGLDNLYCLANPGDTVSLTITE